MFDALDTLPQNVVDEYDHPTLRATQFKAKMSNSVYKHYGFPGNLGENKCSLKVTLNPAIV